MDVLGIMNYLLLVLIMILTLRVLNHTNCKWNFMVFVYLLLFSCGAPHQSWFEMYHLYIV